MWGCVAADGLVEAVRCSTLSYTPNLNADANHIHPSMVTVFPNNSVCFNVLPSRMKKKNGFRNTRQLTRPFTVIDLMPDAKGRLRGSALSRF